MSNKGIVDRLWYILEQEEIRTRDNQTDEALEYLSKLADGGMRDAISLMDKCLSYSKDLTIENVIKALGVANYDTMMSITDAVLEDNAGYIIEQIETVYSEGKDLKQFIKDYTNFILDVKKYMILGEFEYLQIPQTKHMEEWLDSVKDYDKISDLLSALINLNSTIKYDSSPKYTIEAYMLEVIK